MTAIQRSSTTPSDQIGTGRAVLGIELGSTRIKACLIGAPTEVLATGTYDWENELRDGLWTYPIEQVWTGLQQAFADLSHDVSARYGPEVRLTRLRAVGVSAMMHGYLPLAADGALLAPFRTWRNTNTTVAARRLSEEFGVNIPLRWSIAHLYQAMLDGETHVGNIAQLTTLAGYVHYRLTDRAVLGVGDASGMAPIDPATGGYDLKMLTKFDALAADTGVALSAGVLDLLPTPLPAGADAGTLTEQGAALLDPSGILQPGALFCPPEGDAGTGMVATGAVAPRTGNVSVGTSVFAMIVLEGPLARPLPEVDVVTTPAGDPVAMVHCNNGASELAAWAALFRRFAHAQAGDEHLTLDAVFHTLLTEAARADVTAEGLYAYNYLSGEPIVGLSSGRPLVVRTPAAQFSLGGFVRAQLFSVFATLALGMQVLHDEGVGIDRMHAHGGVFRTAGVAQQALAAALNSPVAVSNTAAEGGAWGVALLALYAAVSQPKGAVEAGTLQQWLDDIFTTVETTVALPDPVEAADYVAWLQGYRGGLAVQRAAIDAI